MMFLPLAVLATLAPPAESWRMTGRGDNIIGYVDATSVVRSGDEAFATTMAGVIDGDSGEVYFVRSQMRFNCARSSYRFGEQRYYTRDRVLRQTDPATLVGAYKVTTPDDLVLYPMLKFACTGAGGEPVGDPFTDAPVRLDI